MRLPLLLALFVATAAPARAWQRVPVELEPEGFVRSRFERQYEHQRIAVGPLRAHLALSVHDQRLSVRVSSGPARDFVVDLARDVALSFRVTSMCWAGERRLLLGGRSNDGRHGRLACVVLDVPRASIDRAPREWEASELRSVTALSVYPDSSRAVVLDTLGGGLWMCELADGRLRRVLDADEHPLLLRTNELELRRDRERTRLTIDVLTQPRGCSPGRFDGPSLGVYDLGVDGTLDSVHCGPACRDAVAGQRDG